MADAAVCTVGGPCALKPRGPHDTSMTGCTYYDQRTVGLHSPVSVLNYAYWLSQANRSGLFSEIDLLICDEAHTIEDEIRRYASISFRRQHFKTLSLPFPRARDDLAKWKRWAVKFGHDWSMQYHEIKKARGFLNKADRKWYVALTSLFEGAVSLLSDDLPDDGWTLKETIYGVEARPVWVRPLVPKLLSRHSGKFLFMSATILSAELFAHQLDLPANEVEFIRADCPFPKSSRPIHYRPVGRVSTSNDESLDALVESVDTILANHPGERGLIHTVSYKLARIIAARSKYPDRILTHDTSAQKNTALAIFRATPGAVLLSPSVTTGVDLPYDLCRFQVIAKLAFPDLGDPQIKKRMKLGPDGEPDPLAQRWYSWSAACELVQAYGRGVRAEDDACTTYLLDGNWKWFRHTVRDMLPRWFTEAFVKTPSTNGVRIEEIVGKHAKSA